MSIAILIPTYGRPHRVRPLVRNIRQTTTLEHSIVFIVESGDVASFDAVMGLDLVPLVLVNRRSRNYAGAINTGRDYTTEPYLFCGADDLEFRPGWDTAALAEMRGRIEVVGTNDLVNPYVVAGMHSTHHLVARSYLDRDGGCVDEGPGSFLHEGYGHNYTDTEFIATAKMRCRFMPCEASVVRHAHHSLTGERDATTEKEEATYGADSVLYDERSHLWHSLSR